MCYYSPGRNEFEILERISSELEFRILVREIFDWNNFGRAVLKMKNTIGKCLFDNFLNVATLSEMWLAIKLWKEHRWM